MTRSSSSFRRQTRRTDVQETEPSSIRENIISFVNKVQTQIDLSIFMYVCKYVCTSIVQLQLGKLVIDIRSSVTIALFHLGCIKKYMVHIQTRINFSIPSSVIFFLNFQFFSSATSQLSSEWNYGVVNFPKKSNEKNSSNWKKALYYELV